MAFACTRRRYGRLHLGRYFIATAAACLAAAPASAQSPEPAGGEAASRWTLPPANVAMRSAVLGGSSRMEQVLVAQGSVQARPAVARYAPPVPGSPGRSAPPAGDRPNVFGTVALAVSHTPLDLQWQRANAAAPASVQGWTRDFPALTDANREALLAEVNLWVNRRIAFTDDARVHGLSDRWSGAAETLRRGRGDCEDYALTKMQLLAALGFDRNDMYLVVLRDVLRQGDHAVLVVRAGGRFLVLDNLRDALVDSEAIGNYRPIMSYSATGRWVHGYALAPEGRPIEVAAGGSYTAP